MIEEREGSSYHNSKPEHLPLLAGKKRILYRGVDHIIYPRPRRQHYNTILLLLLAFTTACIYKVLPQLLLLQKM